MPDLIPASTWDTQAAAFRRAKETSETRLQTLIKNTAGSRIIIKKKRFLLDFHVFIFTYNTLIRCPLLATVGSNPLKRAWGLLVKIVVHMKTEVMERSNKSGV